MSLGDREDCFSEYADSEWLNESQIIGHITLRLYVEWEIAQIKCKVPKLLLLSETKKVFTKSMRKWA